MTPSFASSVDFENLRQVYLQAEQSYLESLPLEHFMEATAQGTQRKITLESFDLIHVSRPDVQCFNELLVQYPRPGQDPARPAQVVPDNMVVIHPEPIAASGSFNTPFQPVRPFLVLEYVSKYNQRKDYEVNFERYQNELQVPYYLLFHPDAGRLSLYEMMEDAYSEVRPNAAGRLAIPELELEVALLDGWVRYWFQGELLPLPGDLLIQLKAVEAELEQERTARLAAESRARSVEVELARLREEIARLKQTP
jgi:Uma2 family endonuclease